MGSAEDLVELKRKLLAGEIDAEAYRQAKIAAYRQAGAPAPRAEPPAAQRALSPAEAAIEAKRRKLAASLAAKRQAPPEPARPRVVVVVRPRGRRRAAPTAVRLVAPTARVSSPAPTPLSDEDEITRRLREARERLQGG